MKVDRSLSYNLKWLCNLSHGLMKSNEIFPVIPTDFSSFLSQVSIPRQIIPLNILKILCLLTINGRSNFTSLCKLEMRLFKKLCFCTRIQNSCFINSIIQLMQLMRISYEIWHVTTFHQDLFFYLKPVIAPPIQATSIAAGHPYQFSSPCFLLSLKQSTSRRRIYQEGLSRFFI